MKKIVLVGGNGLVGQHFMEFYETFYHTDQITRSTSKEKWTTTPFDALIFLAQSKDYKVGEFTEDLFGVNLQLLHSCLRNAVGKTKKIILFSSGSVYDFEQDYLDEDSALNLTSENPYFVSKIMAELLIQTFKPFFESITVVRPFFIYGKHQKQNMLFASLIHNIKNGNPITLNGGKGLIFNPIHAQDVAEFIHQSIQEEYQGFRTVNLFGPQLTDLSEVVSYMEQELHQKANLIINTNPPSSIIAKTKNSVVFQSKIGIQEGLKKMIHNN